MTKRFIITKDDFGKRNRITIPIIITIVFGVFLQVQYEYIHDKIFATTIIGLFIALGLTYNLIKTYSEIGYFIISPDKFQITIDNSTRTFIVGNKDFESIKFAFKSVKGDQPASVVFGSGIFYFHNGTGNTFDIKTQDYNYSFDIKIDSRQDYKFLKKILLNINEMDNKVIVVKK